MSEPEHDTEGDCWCEPRIEIIEDDDGNESRLIIHRGPPDSDDESMQ